MSKNSWHVPALLSIGLIGPLSPAFCDEVVGIPTGFNSAMTGLTQQIQANPTAANYKNRADVLRRMGMRKEAVDDLNQSLTLEPSNVAANVLRGQVYFEDGMYPEAVTSINKAITLDPKFAASYALRARSFIKLKEWSKALADANTMLQYIPNAPVGLLLRGAAYHGLGKYQNCIDDCTAAINADPKLDKAYYWRAEAYQDSGEYEKSVADYAQAIKLQPNFRPAYLGLAKSYYKLGKDAEALQNCNYAMTFHDASDLRAVNKYQGNKATDSGAMPDPEYNLGMQIEEDLKDCLSIYNDILKEKPGEPDALRYRGLAYMHLGKYRDAIKDFEGANKGLPVNPKDFSGLGSKDAYNEAIPEYKLGNQDLADGKYDSAVAHYQAALKKYPQYGRAWHNLAIACESLGDNFTAELCCIHSISYRPDDWKLWQTLGGSLYREYKSDKGDPKKLDAAAEALHQALLLKPDTESDKNDIRQLLASVKSYERSLTPAIDFQITTMPIN